MTNGMPIEPDLVGISGKDDMSSPLRGCRICDLTTVMMGPYATQMLGDLGADIIKVEPLNGDGMRSVGPMLNERMGPLYLHANRNKRSIAIDLKNTKGYEAFTRVLKDADALVFNARPEAMARLKLDYDSIKLVNPDIVYCGAYGFGNDGPYAGRPAYDDLIQGLVSVPALGLRAGQTEPRYAPVVMADRIVGLNVAIALLAALFRRQRTGKGARIEVPMFEAMASFVLGDHMGGQTFQPPIGEMGYSRLLSAHRKPYATSDGYICVVVYTDLHWRSFFSIVRDGVNPDTDPRFRDLNARTRHIDELYGLVAKHLATRKTAEWLSILNDADIPAAPMHTPESLLQDEHLEAVGFFRTVDHPTEGRTVQMRRPSNWLGEVEPNYMPAPTLGQHTAEILSEAGLSQDEICALVISNAVLPS